MELSNIVENLKKQRKLLLTFSVISTGIGVGFLGLAYLVKPDYYQEQLKQDSAFCRDLLDKASGDNSITNFVYDRVTFTNDQYKNKTCREIINEYRKREQ